jgi:secondary thiamine-phosphate synthase enzyme
MVISRRLSIETQGRCDIVDVTASVSEALESTGLQNGIVTVFCPGATGSVTTIEYEAGVVADVRRSLDEIAPPGRDYAHHLRWGDDNGHSHVRAALLGPSVTVPFAEGQLLLGTWQHIAFLDFDTRPRSRRLVAQFVGE